MPEKINTAKNLLNIESLINSHDSRLLTLEKELKTNKSMLDDLLNGDKEYLDANDAAKKASKIKTLAKGKVMQHTEAKALVDKIKDAAMQVKELKVALSDYLAQYVTLSGTNTLTAPDGAIWEIIYSAHINKKTS
ncbi:MAG: hypothetical protein NTY75_00975 [Candidatus Shapirobacteria bacterium]|nr:hypothetical protein [Candidatus Shapirobacteria bacterium]